MNDAGLSAAVAGARDKKRSRYKYGLAAIGDTGRTVRYRIALISASLY